MLGVDCLAGARSSTEDWCSGLTRSLQSTTQGPPVSGLDLTSKLPHRHCRRRNHSAGESCQHSSSFNRAKCAVTTVTSLQTKMLVSSDAQPGATGMQHLLTPQTCFCTSTIGQERHDGRLDPTRPNSAPNHSSFAFRQTDRCMDSQVHAVLFLLSALSLWVMIASQ